MLAEILLYLERYDESLMVLERAPNLVSTHELRGEVYLAQGRPQEALDEMLKEPQEAWKNFGTALAYHALHRQRDSETALIRLLIAEHQRVAASQIAEIYAYRHENDQAFYWLERACRQHDSGLGRLKVNWLLRSLRDDPRYAQLLTKVNLAD